MFHVTMDSAFDQVINLCAQVRLQNNQDTWIVEEMIDAYCKLHELGFAHSVEAWYQGELAGGLYGVSLGGVFFWRVDVHPCQQRLECCLGQAGGISCLPFI